MKQSTRILLAILLVVVAVFGIRLYVLLAARLVKSNQELLQTRIKLGQSQEERQLLQEELTVTKAQFQKAKSELKGAHRELKAINNKLTAAEKNNLLLLEEKDKLETRLRSLKELKKAIKEVKIERRQQRVQEGIAKKESQKEVDAQKLAQGNRGFLVKAGQPTHQPKVKIDVQPTY